MCRKRGDWPGNCNISNPANAGGARQGAGAGNGQSRRRSAAIGQRSRAVDAGAIEDDAVNRFASPIKIQCAAAIQRDVGAIPNLVAPGTRELKHARGVHNVCAATQSVDGATGRFAQCQDAGIDGCDQVEIVSASSQCGRAGTVMGKPIGHDGAGDYCVIDRKGVGVIDCQLACIVNIHVPRTQRAARIQLNGAIADSRAAGIGIVGSQYGGIGGAHLLQQHRCGAIAEDAVKGDSAGAVSANPEVPVPLAPEISPLKMMGPPVPEFPLILNTVPAFVLPCLNGNVTVCEVVPSF